MRHLDNLARGSARLFGRSTFGDHPFATDEIHPRKPNAANANYHEHLISTPGRNSDWARIREARATDGISGRPGARGLAPGGWSALIARRSAAARTVRARCCWAAVRVCLCVAPRAIAHSIGNWASISLDRLGQRRWSPRQSWLENRIRGRRCNAPAPELYQFWRDSEQLPRILRHRGNGGARGRVALRTGSRAARSVRRSNGTRRSSTNTRMN